MGLYVENYCYLVCLFELVGLVVGSYIFLIGDGLDVCLDVIECYCYMVELWLIYDIVDLVIGELDFLVYVCLYCDVC